MDAAWIEQLPTEFWLSAVFGSALTVLYAVNEFARPTFQPQPDRPETAFAPVELASFTDYLISFCIYLTGLLAFYWLVCLIGPAPFAGIGLGDSADTEKLQIPGAFPLWVAAILVGVLPRLPVVSYFEQSWRRLMHARARIPHGVRVRAADLNRSEFSFEMFESAVRSGQGLFARNVTSADLALPSTSPSHRWARLSAILQQLSMIDAHPEAAGYVDSQFIDRHRAILSAMTADYLSLADRINRQRSVPPPPQTPPLKVVGDVSEPEATVRSASDDGETRAVSYEHAEEIEALLRRVCIFLACAMFTARQSVYDPDAAMRAFGFYSAPATDVTGEIDVMIGAMVIALIAYCLFVFVTFRIGAILPDWMTETGWPDADLGDDRLLRIVTFMVPQVVSISGALMLRNFFRRKGTWFRSKPRPGMPSVRKYIGLVAVSFVLALVTSSYIAATWQGAAIMLGDVYWRFFEDFIPATSALFVCLAIDSAIVDWNATRRALLASLHAVVATFVAFGAADHYYTSDKGLDFWGAILYSTVGTCFFATTLAVSLLLLTSRHASLGEFDELLPQPGGPDERIASTDMVRKEAKAT